MTQFKPGDRVRIVKDRGVPELNGETGVFQNRPHIGVKLDKAFPKLYLDDNVRYVEAPSESINNRHVTIELIPEPEFKAGDRVKVTIEAEATVKVVSVVGDMLFKSENSIVNDRTSRELKDATITLISPPMVERGLYEYGSLSYRSVYLEGKWYSLNGNVVVGPTIFHGEPKLIAVMTEDWKPND